MTEQNTAPTGPANDGAPQQDGAVQGGVDRVRQQGSDTIVNAPETAAWPQDWRAQLAGAKTLDRYATPRDYFQRTRHLERSTT